MTILDFSTKPFSGRKLHNSSKMDDRLYSIELNDVGDLPPNRFQVNRVATLRRSEAEVVTEVAELDDDDTFDDEIVLRNNRRSSR